jgi:hypothetical protein
MPDALAALIEKLAALIARATSALQAAPSTAPEWETTVGQLLTRYSIAAMMAGKGSGTITPREQAVIDATVAAQLGYLRNFTVEIQNAKEWQAGWDARAESYATSIKVPYWVGRTKMLPLPAMPAQGTQCMGNCKCQWQVNTIDEGAGDYDAYWIRHASDSCQTCVERAGQWNPVQIRGGELQ